MSLPFDQSKDLFPIGDVDQKMIPKRNKPLSLSLRKKSLEIRPSNTLENLWKRDRENLQDSSPLKRAKIGTSSTMIPNDTISFKERLSVGECPVCNTTFHSVLISELNNHVNNCLGNDKPQAIVSATGSSITGVANEESVEAMLGSFKENFDSSLDFTMIESETPDRMDSDIDNPTICPETSQEQELSKSTESSSCKAVLKEKPIDDSENCLIQQKQLRNTIIVEDDQINFVASTSEKENQFPQVPSLSTKKKPPVKGGEDMFTRDQVKDWSPARIKAWEARYSNAEMFYYRFVDPGEYQINGSFTKKDHDAFMKRLEEWKEKGYRIGSSWGIFSMGVPHRAGYQCSSYYRKLIEQGKLKDESYAMIEGKLQMVNKARNLGGEVATSKLSDAWQTPEVKEIEANVNEWLKEFHGRSGESIPQRVRRIPAARSTSANASPRPISQRKLGGNLRPLMPGENYIDDDDDSFQSYKEKLENRKRRFIARLDMSSRLEEYRQFLSVNAHLPQACRRFVPVICRTGDFRSVSKAWEVPTPETYTYEPKERSFSSIFSPFYKVKPKRIEAPDPLQVIIPKEPAQWGVKMITPLSLLNSMGDKNKLSENIYLEVDDMLSLNLDTISTEAGQERFDFQGVLIDPPWDFYLKDDLHDGNCYLTIPMFASIIEKTTQYIKSGIFFVWTHKLLQDSVLKVMDFYDCKYVENLVWYKKCINNANLDRVSPHFRVSKEILLMFKKGDDFEMRHQRSADVIIDFETPPELWSQEEYTMPKPVEVYQMIETLLPAASYDASKGRGRLLELWAKRSSPRRKGWIAVHQRKSPRAQLCQPLDTDVKEEIGESEFEEELPLDVIPLDDVLIDFDVADLASSPPVESKPDTPCGEQETITRDFIEIEKNMCDLN
ncbi:uncharacterized protein VTP21DRAFT_1296 [Calcarisporiella thermophila]|uniref:uncharacterized protein n=1 Tax=Calcarisporiella thermophila TaxID=911321 RepID=UPI0037428692